MPVATLSTANVFALDGFIIRPLAVPSRGSTELALWSVEAAPGAGSVRHSLDHEEVFVVHSGRLTATIAGKDESAAEGDTLIVPADTLFQIRNEGEVTMLATACTTKGLLATVEGEGTFAPPWAQ
jgi:mannose-6-phosphate isomerase-like protein (cupin superfamily)